MNKPTYAKYLFNIFNVIVTKKGICGRHFIYLFDWATGYPDFQSNIILGISVRMFFYDKNYLLNLQTE